MVRRFLACLLVLNFLFSAFGVPGYALKSGEPLGDVLYTDIIAYIDGYPIRSYNINWNTYVVVEDLMEYGFTVDWVPSALKLVISKVRTYRNSGYVTTYKPEKNNHQPGSVATQYLYTEITTWIGDTPITGYNIGGYTCICMDDLAAHFGTRYVWDAENSALRLTTDASAVFAEYLEHQQTNSIQAGEIHPNQSNIRKEIFNHVLVDGKLYQFVYSYELATFYPLFHSYIFHIAENSDEVYFNIGDYTHSGFDGKVFLALLTKSFKTTASDNPYIDNFIDVFMTCNHSKTIDVASKKEYSSAASYDIVSTHSYNGKKLIVPQLSSNSGYQVIDGVRYYNTYINLKDYCKYFGLNVEVKIEFSKIVDRNILVFNFKK